MMKARSLNLVWGIILILTGGLFLAQNLGYMEELPLNTWVIIFSVLSLLFFATYFINGVSQWGWLFPAFIFAGLALTMMMTNAGVASGAVGIPVLIGVALPFVVLYFLNRRENWWALIPAWVLIMVSLLILISERVPGELVGAFVMLAIGLPFLVVYLANRQNWWALIPAGVMLVIAAIILISSQTSGQFVAPLIMFAIAAPFLVVYLRSADNWWALIPAGVMASIGATLLLSGFEVFNIENTGVWNGLILLGIALTFAILWLQRNRQPTDWAKYAAGIALIGAVLAFVLGSGMDLLWPVLLIAGGVVVLFVSLRRRG
jgi:hypothetical protein